MRLIIKYDNKCMQDGIGAQALRLLGLYSISKFFRISYFHSPIVDLIEEFSHGTKEESDLQQLIVRVNTFFNFPSIPGIPPNSKTIKVRQLGLKELLFFRIKSLFSKKTIVLDILLPFGITDRFPFLYKCGVRHLRNRHYHLLQKRHFVVAHIRRGYGYLYSDQRYIRPRNLPFSYFNDCIAHVSKKYFEDSEFRLIVHTDLSPNSLKWKPTQKRVLDGLKEVTGNYNAKEIDIEGIRVEDHLQLPEKCQGEFHYCAEFFDTFLDMCSCEILIQGNSALSYLAGLLNENIVIWPARHGHSKYSTWINSESFGLKIRDDLIRG